MDIRLLKDRDSLKAKALWKEAFGDSDAFIEWYFANKILPGNSLGMFDAQGALVSVVHTIPCTVSIQGRPVESAFIAGAATAQSRRGEGLMRDMLHETLKLLRARGIAITHLHPFKHNFYENFGWTTYSYVRRMTAETPADVTGEVVETNDSGLLAPLYESMMRGYDGCMIRSAREWRWRMGELAADGGRAAVLIKDGVPAAYMLYYDDGEKTDAIETVYSDEEDVRTLLAYVSKGEMCVNYFIPAAPGNAPYGMARIVDAEAFLSLFGAKDALRKMRITDGFAEWNNVGKGREISVADLVKAAHLGARGADGAERPWAGALAKVFLYRDTCIFEQY